MENKELPYCVDDRNKNVNNFSNVIPIWKFILLSLITYWIYDLIWFYRWWKTLQKEDKNLKIRIFWRLFFLPFNVWSFAENMKRIFLEKWIILNFSPSLIWILYFLFHISWKLPDPYSIISDFTVIIMLPLVNWMNKYHKTNEENLPLKKFNWWQIILIMIWIIFYVFIVVITFFPNILD